MRILIIEDETLLARHLKNLVTEIEPSAKTEAVINSVTSAVQWLKQNEQPDLILMDIELADGQSFEIFEQMEVKSPVIFTTAYDEYALKAFKVNSVDYLLKPIKEDDLKRALNKLKTLQHTPQAHENIYRMMEELRRSQAASYRDRILIKKGQKMIPVEISETALFFSMNAVCFLVTKNKQKYVIDYSLDELQQTLDPKKFFRVNRQYVLSHDVITALHNWFNGKLKVEVNVPVEEAIVVSRDKASLLKEWLGK